ncbi:hypothetical protein FQB35_10745 [Crassaminicella thermophila]|uniref:Phosphoglycolate phosphatase, HAD superfamily n=1 Tax=Crassaminicella thermophila TaxID=2599308 RepID=A0A5C0SHT7_CRATE|nr:HAD family hydrolase [Crassaminicella thermophila]QEK12768.1 hypothetical protein FQB35_10745 [Crassaminicella thermophila]
MKNILMIWDIDGTLINSRGCGRKAMEEAFCSIFGIEKAFNDINMAGRLDAIILKDALYKHGIVDVDMTLFFDTYCNILENILMKKDYIKILPGIEKILESGSEYHNFFHALGTGNIEKGARIKLKAYDLNKYFPVGGFGDEELERWQIIHKAVESAQAFHNITYDKENIYVIGDTPRDIECAKILGVKSIAVATGSHSLEELMEHLPDYLFESFEDTEKFFCIFK